MHTLLKDWLSNATEDTDLLAELSSLRDQGDEAGIHDRFYRELSFGTGGLRGVIGAGTNRMNIYTVRKATKGVASWLGSGTSVAIAYDSRRNSALFAREAARVLAAQGITAWLYPRLMPTPALSFAVRHLGCEAGICITASHNPAQYNGYKVYGHDGCQITLGDAERILHCMEGIDPFQDVKTIPLAEGLEKGYIRWIGEDTMDAFLAAVLSQSTRPSASVPFRIVYTPLNGAGRECVTRTLTAAGFTDITLVPEQAEPDENFTTCPYPNPEVGEALRYGLALCQSVQPDLLLATDPDCDRVGVAVKHEGKYQLLSGNEVGVLLLDYLCKWRRQSGMLPDHAVAVTTVVSTDMADLVARRYQVELRRVLTGFKYIGEQIGLLEQEGEARRFILGFEESNGYLTGTHVRDKDAVNASLVICEMARNYKALGQTLVDVLAALYAEYGYYQNELCVFTFEGAEGMRTIAETMSRLRQSPPQEIAGFSVLECVDYESGIDGESGAPELPPTDMLSFLLERGKLIVRPSGTEPTLKMYLSVSAKNRLAAQERMKKLKDAVNALV